MTGSADSGESDDLGFLAGGGELGALMRALRWQDTPLGPPDHWPNSLKLATRIMLASRQPIWIGWGDALTYLYNDAYKSIIGGKHPWALGRPAREVWSEIWQDIGPMLEQALGGDQGTYVESQLLIMERNGYPEETYYTFSYSPIPNDDGSVGGILCANSDDTQRVIDERQLASLRDVAAEAGQARHWQEACERAAVALTRNPRDLPFALIYAAEPDGKTALLAGAAGIAAGHPAAPPAIDLSDPAPWPIADILRDHALRHVARLDDRLAETLPRGPWPLPPRQVALVPILPSGETGRAGVLVVGLNPFRLFDDGYRSFLGLVSGQISAAIANAQAYEEERRRAESLAELDRAKTAFFSNVSHEFRTPLTLMLGPLEDTLNDARAKTLSPAHRQRLETAYRNSLRLLKLVNSLLDFSRIEAGRLERRLEAVDLARFTTDLAATFQSATERAGLYLRIDCPPLPRPVHVDRDMWEKIVLNLLSNAFKFTLEGGIEVVLRSAHDEAAAVLTVRDTGVGIPPHELPRLFERFHRIEGQRSRSFEGSGIGLALVQELVRLHGGRIAADSRPGVGTAFSITLPLGGPHPPAGLTAADRPRPPSSLRAAAYVEEALRWLPDSAPASPEERADDGSFLPLDVSAAATRILVVDDNADMRQYLRRLLGGRWTIETAADGEQALEAIQAHRPDLVLTDVMMPRLDGFSLLRRLRADPALRDLPVIVLSARAGEEARVEGLDAGADDYLTKPFSARELVARVNANLGMARLRREMTRELRESEVRFRNMAEHAPVMMWVTDASGALTYVNRPWSDFTGLAAERSLGDGAWQALHPEDRERARRDFLAANAAHAPFRLEYRLRRHDGTWRWAMGAATPRFAEDGGFRGYIGSVIDIGDRKEAEQVLQQANDELERRVAAAVAERAETESQLRQAQKMEAIGRLTGGVAHDFNNVLQVIGGNLQLLERDVAGNLRAEHRLQTAIAAISRGSKLASQLLAFGRRQPLAPKVTNLGRLVRGIDALLRRALGEGIELETIVAGGLWNTFVDAVQVENALLNLAINARDAMAGNGRITIEAGNASLDDAYAQRHAEVSPGQYVMLAVSDTGSGIPPEIIDHVFEPFFTTKPEGQGTGLGLSMVYGFVKQSGGHIKIYSEPGQGTTVRLYLPRARAEEATEPSTGIAPATGGSETILVVEDDDEVRRTVVDLLSDLGYRVLKARDAQSALAVVDSGASIDVLFTDVVMPGTMRSPELARRAKERLPGLAVLFTSGYTENAIVHGGRLDPGIELLSKPYSREALARRIRHVLRNQQQRVHARARPPADAGTGDEHGRATRPATATPPATLRILLVEDDGLILLSTAEMLTSMGHHVTCAPDAEAALERLGEDDFDVLVTDLSLPRMSGAALAAEAVRRQPGLRVVYATGHADPAVTPRADGAVVLPKPYNEAGLAAALRDAR